tara:strand:+ start:351 stop:629 length:279 start_codon:yes stop_codon:yes gene_type:complete
LSTWEAVTNKDPVIDNEPECDFKPVVDGTYEAVTDFSAIEAEVDKSEIEAVANNEIVSAIEEELALSAKDAVKPLTIDEAVAAVVAIKLPDA